MEIKRYCKKLGYNYSIHQYGKVALVSTMFDSWKLTAKQFINRGELVNRIEVRHYSKKLNKKRENAISFPKICRHNV